VIRVLGRTKTLKHLTMDKPFRKTESLDHVTLLMFTNAILSCKPLNLFTICKLDFEPAHVYQRVRKRTFLETSWYSAAVSYRSSQTKHTAPAVAQYGTIMKNMHYFAKKVIIFLTVLGNMSEGVDYNGNNLDMRAIRAAVAALRCRHKPKFAKDVKSLDLSNNLLDLDAAKVLATLWWRDFPAAGSKKKKPSPDVLSPVNVDDLIDGVDAMNDEERALQKELEREALELKKFEESLVIQFNSKDMSRFKDVFYKFDEDSSGTIDIMELKQVLLFLGSDAAPEDVRAMQKTLSHKDDGLITFDEFLSLMEIHRKQEIVQFRAGFNKFDLDSSGNIDVCELRDVLEYTGFAPTEAMMMLVLKRVAAVQMQRTGNRIEKSGFVEGDGRSWDDVHYIPEDFEGIGIEFDEFMDLMEFFRDTCAAETRAREAMQVLQRYGVDIGTAFDAFNQDGEGNLTVAEFRHGLESVMRTLDIPFALTEEEWTALVNKLDDDGSGEIGLDEFKNFVEDRHEDLAMDDMGKVGEAFTQDDKGFFETKPSVENLNVSDNKLEDAGLEILCEGIANYSEFHTLQARNVAVGPEGLWCISVLPVGLTCLSLSKNEFGDEGLKLLCTALLRKPEGADDSAQETRFPYLRRLELSDCDLSELSMNELAFVLTRSPRLEHLLLNANSLGDEGVRRLCCGEDGTGGVARSGLAELGINDNKFSSAKATGALASASTSCLTLKTIDVGENSLDGEAALKKIGQMIASSSLEMVLMTNMEFSEEEVQWFIDGGASDSESLHIWNLNLNPIGDNGLTFISECMPISLHELYLSNCGISPESKQTLVNLLALAPNLRILDLSVNELGSEALADMVNWLALNEDQHSLRILNLNDTALEDEGFECTAPILGIIEELHVQKNKITSAGLKNVVNSQSLIQLQICDLSCNLIDEEGVHQLTERFQQEHKRSLWNPKQLTSNIDTLYLSKNDIPEAVAKSTDAFLKIHLPLMEVIW